MSARPGELTHQEIARLRGPRQEHPIARVQDRKLQAASVRATLPRFAPQRGHPYGWLDPQQWTRFGEWMQDYNPFHEGCFESDHCFDNFISPVSNPFLFEDPRSLTEVRPIFLYQTIPNSNALFRGGNAEFFGLQARLAITDRWSVVINKLGGVSINPGSDSPLPGDTGFSEFWIGPKYTFLRNTETGTVAAAGVTFQLPVGSAKAYQDTGMLSLVPYLTAAQSFGHTSYGSFMERLGRCRERLPAAARGR